MKLGPNAIQCWKIVEIEESTGQIKTLFHGNNGSRKLPRGEWLEAQERPNVRDGVGPRYLSGWHVFKSVLTASRYLQRFRKKRWLVFCFAEELRKKSHSRSDVWLAKRIFIPGAACYTGRSEKKK
jgi:hypothetical protein